MKKLWLIEIEGTPKAVERFDDLLDSLVIDASYDDVTEKKPLKALTSWYFPSWAKLMTFIRGLP